MAGERTNTPRTHGLPAWLKRDNVFYRVGVKAFIGPKATNPEVSIPQLLSPETRGVWFLINKKLSTSSNLLFTAEVGLVVWFAWRSVIGLSTTGRWRGVWTMPFVIFGRNAITAYIVG